MLEMLDQARDCRPLEIQNPDSDQVFNRLKSDRPRLRDLIESAPIAF